MKKEKFNFKEWWWKWDAVIMVLIVFLGIFTISIWFSPQPQPTPIYECVEWENNTYYTTYERFAGVRLSNLETMKQCCSDKYEQINPHSCRKDCHVYCKPPLRAGIMDKEVHDWICELEKYTLYQRLYTPEEVETWTASIHTSDIKKNWIVNKREEDIEENYEWYKCDLTEEEMETYFYLQNIHVVSQGSFYFFDNGFLKESDEIEIEVRLIDDCVFYQDEPVYEYYGLNYVPSMELCGPEYNVPWEGGDPNKHCLYVEKGGKQICGREVEE